MASPLATEKVVRGALQALQRGGVISSGSDVAKLESIPNNASDADISAILDTMVFGGVSAATSVIRGDEDVNVFIDADNNDTPLVAPRYFRVAENQSDPPVTTAARELLTLGSWPLTITDNAPTLTIGPRTALAAASYSAVLNLGTDASDNYGRLIASSTAVAGAAAGLSIRSPEKRIDIRSDVAIYAANMAGSIVGGWANPSTETQFNVGDFTAKESILLEVVDLGGVNGFALRPSDDTGTAIRRLYIGGSKAAAGYAFNTIVGGQAGAAWADPSSFSSSTLLVVGFSNAASQTANVMYVHDRMVDRNGGSEVCTIKSDANPIGKYYILRVFDHLGTAVFSVTSDGKTNGPTGFTTGLADVAEVVVADQEYEPGTVLAIQQGLYTQTVAVAQPNVAGVVATAPGLLLGTTNNYDQSKEFRLTLLHTSGKQRWLTVSGYVADRIGTHIRIGEHHFVGVEETIDEGGRARVHLKEDVHLFDGVQIHGGIVHQPNRICMAVCGIVPVLCSTAGGDILGNGEILVSGPGGCAIVDLNPKPGTIVGKAQGRLVQNGSGVVKAKIEVLVNLQ